MRLVPVHMLTNDQINRGGSYPLAAYKINLYAANNSTKSESAKIFYLSLANALALHPCYKRERVSIAEDLIKVIYFKIDAAKLQTSPKHLDTCRSGNIG